MPDPRALGNYASHIIATDNKWDERDIDDGLEAMFAIHTGQYDRALDLLKGLVGRNVDAVKMKAFLLANMPKRADEVVMDRTAAERAETARAS